MSKTEKNTAQETVDKQEDVVRDEVSKENTTGRAGEDLNADAGAKADEAAGQAAGDDTAEPLPPPDFSTFVLSLSSAVLMHLGEIANPSTGKPAPNHSMARHTIDLIDMLEAKTKGNLSESEEKLIRGVLYDLRMRYCTATEKQA